MMATLYELAPDFVALADLLDSEQAVDPNVDSSILKAVEASKMALGEKAEACVMMIREFEAKAKARKEERDRFATSAKHAQGAADRIKAYLLYVMQSNSLDKIDAGRFNLNRQKCGGKRAVAFVDELVPDEFRVIVETEEIDRDAAREAALANPNVKWATVAEQGERVRIH